MSSDQYLRKVSLVVSEGTSGLDLSSLRVEFRVSQSDLETPNSAVIRVINLSSQTARAVQKEFTRVTLQAGYERGNFGIVFQGDIKAVRRGRMSGENNVDTYLDILAADGDLGYNFGVVRKTMAAGYTQRDVLDEAAKAMDIPVGYFPDIPLQAATRGKVLWGMARNYARDASNSIGCAWSIQNGKISVVPITGYVPGEAVVLNAQSGMIGLPEQTEGGVTVRCLLNPKIRVGGLVQIDNSSIQRTFLGGNLLNAPGRLDDASKYPGLLPRITDDGFYRVYVAEFEGDSREGPFFSDLTCLAVDRSSPVNSSVSADGSAGT